MRRRVFINYLFGVGPSQGDRSGFEDGVLPAGGDIFIRKIINEVLDVLSGYLPQKPVPEKRMPVFFNDQFLSGSVVSMDAVILPQFLFYVGG